VVNITHRTPTESDIIELGQSLRQWDIDELQAVTTQTPSDSVRASVLNSDPRYCWAYHADGKLLCLCGCTRSGAPWLLATPLLNHHTKRLTQTVKREVRMMLKTYPRLANMIDVRSTQTIRWLTLLGFRFTETLELKPGFPVIFFEMVCDVKRTGEESP
jgi:hypothetical protein